MRSMYYVEMQLAAAQLGSFTRDRRVGLAYNYRAYNEVSNPH